MSFKKEKLLICTLYVSMALLSAWSLFSCSSGIETSIHEAPVPKDISYNLHIRPILSDNCFACHGPDANKREAGLRLDIAEEAYKALVENPDSHAIVPGKPHASQAFLRISTKDESLIMPPAESNLSLSEREIRLIEKWIEEGAAFEPHWAFVPPKKSPLPEIRKKERARNALDYFVIAEQEKWGLELNAEAGKEMLLRRLSFDLTGLPPSISLMDSFLADESVGAYEKILDELLSKEAYGEKMAVHWMDVARYADSHGYQDDYFRSQWPWRDWVIHAFNEN